METDIQNDDLDVSLKEDEALENSKYILSVDKID